MAKRRAQKLTDRQEAFCCEYIIDMNATEAAKRAGYSEKTCAVLGYQLLQKPLVSKRISDLMEARSVSTGVDAEWVLTRLAAELDADVADLFDDEGNVKPIMNWPPIWRKGLIAGFEVVRIGEGAGGTVTKVKLTDRGRKLELIGKHVDVQAWRERSEVEHTGIPDTQPTSDDMKAAILARQQMRERTTH